MRILFVVNKLIFGGAETQLIALSSELARRGHAVVIYTLHKDNPRIGELAGSGVRVVEDQKRHKLDVALIVRLRRFLREFRADVVQGILVDGNLHARLAAAGTGVPALNSERNDNYEWPLQHRVGVWLTRGLAAGLVANSHAGARFAQRRFKLADSNVHVVWNGIDVAAVEARAAAPIDPAMEFFDSRDVKIACLVGMIRPAKDYALALQVAEELFAIDNRWRVLFVGDSIPQTNDYKTTVMTAARDLIERRIVAFAGLRKDVPAIVGRANVLFSTSIHEGFPNVILEAMAVGTPVASTDFSDIRMILPCEGQVANTRRPADVARTIVRADRERTEISSRQAAWLHEHGTIATAAERLEGIFRQYIAQPAAGRTQAPHVCFFALDAWPVLSRSLNIASVGGAEVQQVLVARQLAQRGFRVTMICGDFGQPDVLTVDGIRVLKHAVGRSQIPVLRYFHPRLTSIWRSLLKADADIFYQRSASAATGVIALFARWHRRRFVYAAAHDLDVARDRTWRLFQRGAGGRDRRIFTLGLKFADAIVVQHDGQAADCRRWFQRTPVRVPSCYRKPADARADESGVVLWVATLRAWKRPELFLDLAKRLPTVRFRMIGGPGGETGDAELFSRIKAEAATLSNLDFVGFVPHASIEEHFNGARVFVNTSQYEGFPNTFLQAWARGIPTVSFCTTGSVFEGSPVGTTVTAIGDMVAAVDGLMRDDVRWWREGERSRRYVERAHSVEAAVLAYEGLFEMLCPQAARTTAPIAPDPLCREGIHRA